MTEIHIWPTLVGVVALTPDAFGFSFCGNEAEVAQLRSDLEAGTPMGRAVGFSGSACSFKDLVRVQAKQGSPTIVVVAREFLGKAQEDFTFRRQADREAFYETILRFLGPPWKCQRAARTNRLAMLLLIGGVLFGVFSILCGGLLLVLPPRPNKPGVEPMTPGAMWSVVGIGLVVTALCVAGVYWARRAGRTTWETISAR